MMVRGTILIIALESGMNDENKPESEQPEQAESEGVAETESTEQAEEAPAAE